MGKASDAKGLALLQRALASPYGIEVNSPNAQTARVKLTHLRNKVNDPALRVLQFRIAPDGSGNLWITKGLPEKPPPTVGKPKASLTLDDILE